ncbi:MAG: homoserine dehydrogenase [Acidobacteria bacterium]|nr:homoserine dehydrogenase [Acidobacteriota bacterium]
MITLVHEGRTVESAVTPAPGELSIALLGLGKVGSSVAALALDPPPSLTRRLRIIGALVRRPAREPELNGLVALTTDAVTLLESQPDVVVELLGGVEPARSLILAALNGGIPVVTANKSLLARHGDELLDAAARTGTPLRYEASVIAGVPFLGTFSRRPLASDVRRITGIVNGTSNFILSTMTSEGTSFADALTHSQRRGFAEPDPSKDVGGIDAAEKLSVLLRQFGGWSVHPDALDVSGIDGLTVEDLRQAAVFGGAVKPVIHAEWTGDEAAAFAGPAFVSGAHPLARIDGVQNAVCLLGRSGELCLAGPGAGPDVTAATVIDDVLEVVDQDRERQHAAYRGARRPRLTEAATGWFVRVTAETKLPDGRDVSDLLSADGVWLRRVSDRGRCRNATAQWLLTYPCSRTRLDRALLALCAAAGCSTFAIRALEGSRE